MKKLLLILVVFMVLVFSSNSIAAQYIVLDSEDEVSPKISYQYYYSVTENVVKVEFVTYIDEEDQMSCAEIVDAKIGDIFIGTRTYVLQEQSTLTQTQIEYLANQGIVVVGEWVPVPIDEASDSIVSSVEFINNKKDCVCSMVIECYYPGYKSGIDLPFASKIVYSCAEAKEYMEYMSEIVEYPDDWMEVPEYSAPVFFFMYPAIKQS